MKQIVFTISFCLVTIFTMGQNKKDGTPDMRYKANKEVYGNQPSSPSYFPPTKQRNYPSGGQLKMQKGYMKSNGTYVNPHLKITPDNYRYNNLNNK